MANVVKDIDRYILTGLGRLLVLLSANNGKLELREARKTIGTTVYTAVLNGTKLGLLDYDESHRIIFLKEEGKKIAQCLTACLHYTNQR